MTVASFTEQRARRAELLAELDASGAFLKQLCDDGATAEARRLAWDEYNAAYIELTKVETDIRVHELGELWERTQSADSRGLGDLGDLRADTRDYARRVKELKSQIVSVGPNFAKTWLPVIESLEDGIDQVQSRVLHRAEERWAVLQSSKDLSTTVCVRRYGAARAIRSTRASSPRRRVANKSPGRSSGDDPPPLPDLAPLTGGAT